MSDAQRIDSDRRNSVMMMDGSGSMMMWGMGAIWLLILVLIVLAIAALIKYLRKD